MQRDLSVASTVTKSLMLGESFDNLRNHDAIQVGGMSQILDEPGLTKLTVYKLNMMLSMILNALESSQRKQVQT